MKIEKRLITPDTAKTMLKKNSCNRPLRKSNLHYLSDEIKSGNWMLTGDPIKFSTKGILLDGQHRLNAIIMSGKSVETFVATDCDEKIFTVIDTGASRSASDVFVINGVPNSLEVGAVSRLIIKYKKGYFNKADTHIKKKLSNESLLAFYKRNKTRIGEALETARYVKTFLPNVSKSIIGGLYFIFSEIDEKKAEQFFESLSNGIDLEKDDPILLLRDKMIKEREWSNNSGFNTVGNLALSFTAWNHFRKRKKLDRLIWDRRNEEMPEPV